MFKIECKLNSFNAQDEDDKVLIVMNGNDEMNDGSVTIKIGLESVTVDARDLEEAVRRVLWREFRIQ